MPLAHGTRHGSWLRCKRQTGFRGREPQRRPEPIKLLVFTCKRLLWSVPTIAGLIAVVFVISHIIPADPVALLAGESATPEQVEALRTQLGFDQPVHVQLANYYLDLLRGDLGTSLYTARPIVDDLNRRLPATIELTLVAMIVSIAVGIPLGVLSALHRNSLLDHLLRVITVSGLAIASFWLGIMFQLLFSMELEWTPLNGRISGFPPRGATGLFLVDTLVAGKAATFFDALHHLVLPTMTLAFPALATVVRFTRAGVLDVIQSGFVTYQQSMGVPWTVIAWKYVLRNALISTVTQIGLLFGILLAGTVVIETVFDWPGVGQYAFVSILQSDYNAIMGFTVWAGVMFVLVNLFVDILHGFIDPRETRA